MLIPTRVVRRSLFCAVGLLLACTSPTEMCACPPARSHAVIYGSIANAAGDPVAGASVQAVVYGSVCGEGYADRGGDANPVVTSSSGTYRIHVYSLLSGAACVRVATHAVGAPDSTYVDAALFLRDERQAPDSLKVDLQVSR